MSDGTDCVRHSGVAQAACLANLSRVPQRAARPATVTGSRDVWEPRGRLSARTALALVAATVVLLPVSGVAQAEPVAPPPPCSNRTAPPPPVDTSEVPAPGEPSPEPLPVPDTPVGGERLGACDEPVVPQGAPPPPTDLTSPTWLVADLDSGEVLAALDPHARHRPASTIKTLTALTVLRDLDLDDRLVATQEDANREGSKVGLAPGASYTVRQVLAGLMMQSGNDAAHALAMKRGGLDVSVARMNEIAREIGAVDTRAATPSGLDGPGMSTSAYDMALIFRAAMSDPEFRKVIGTTRTELPGPPGQPSFPVSNDNRVLLNYPGGIGGKTGFTNDAQHTFVGAADRDGRRLVAVMLRGANQPEKLSQQTMRLLDYGYTLPPGSSVGTLNQPEPEPPAPVAAAEPPAGGEQDQAAQSEGSALFDSLGAPLTLLFGSGLVIVGSFGFWRYRTKLAAAQRRDTPPD